MVSKNWVWNEECTVLYSNSSGCSVKCTVSLTVCPVENYNIPVSMVTATATRCRARLDRGTEATVTGDPGRLTLHCFTP